MQSPSRPAGRNGFHIAIICALPFESDAVDLLFDDVYNATYGRADGDTNFYTTGRIGNHAVVLLVLPNMGKEAAAACSRSLQSSFPNIKLALIVGVCGGLPSVRAKDVLPRVGDNTERDLFLGDVVISTSIINYDFGRQYMGHFAVKSSLEDSLGRANSDIRGLLALLQREHDFGRLRSKATQNLTRLQSAAVEKGRLATYQTPPDDTDNVFPADYEHAHYNKECHACSANHFCEGVSNLSCHEAGCNWESCEPRQNRQQQRPRGLFPHIFMGKIASGNVVMKSGRHRDQVAKDYGVIAFEMEGAGAWDQVPCIVVKGVCDYADSHKNKKWQSFAAATAASVAVAILDHYDVPGSDAGGAAISAEGGLPMDNIQPVTHQMLIDQLYFDKIDERLTTLAPAHTTTCRWVFASPEYTCWHDPIHQREHGGFLWIKGHPGTGKSTLMKLLFEEAKLSAKKDPFCITLSFFFLARGTMEERSTTGLYRSLLYQLLEKAPDVRDSLEWLTASGVRVIHRAGWDNEALKATLRRAVQRLGERAITFFVDALDECDQTQVNDMVCFFEELCEHVRETHVQLRICFSSRHYPSVVIQQGIELVLEDKLEHTDDILLYIKSKLRIGRTKKAEVLQAEILEKSGGIFLWVVLVLDIINAEYPNATISIAKIRTRLEEIPPRLHDLFHMILTRDGNNMQQLRVCLMWILLATRPLKPQELYFGVQFAVDRESSGYWDPDDVSLEDMKEFVRSASKGLANVTKTKSADVQFIHESVRDFLRGDYCVQWSGITDNLMGHGHQLLKYWCLRQLNTTRRRVDIPDHTETQSPEANVRNEILSQLPFLEYSALNILSHANAAQQAGMDQRSFVDNFPLDQWRLHFNIVEQFKARRYTKDVSMLYVLSERNLAALIRIHPLRHTGFDIGTQRYGPPIFAAVAMDANDAVRELLKAQEERLPDSSPSRGLSQQYRPTQNGSIVRSFEFQRKTNRTVFSYLAQHGNDILLKVFLSAASGDLADKDWKTMLLLAAKEGREAVVKLLLETGKVDVESKDEFGRTPLSTAAEKGHGAIVKLLLETGKVDVDSKDNEGRTPLSRAAENGREAVVKLLLETGKVDVESKDELGRTPMSTAVEKGHEAVVKLLLNKPVVASSVSQREINRQYSEETPVTVESKALTQKTHQRHSQDTPATDVSSTSIHRQDIPDSDDNVSTYTIQTIPRSRHYIESFTDVLFNEALDEFPDEGTMDRLCGSLPDLLRGFALGLGGEKNEAASKQAMAFVASQRRGITASFRARYLKEKDDNKKLHLRAQENMQSVDIVDMWKVEYNIGSGSDPIPDALFPGHEVEGEESEFERAQSNVGSYEDSSCGSEDSDSGRDLGADAADEEAPDLPRYKRTVSESTAYRWLVARLHREFTLTRPTHSISAAIRKRLYSRAENRHISRRRGPPVCTLVFQSQWDPLAVVACQEYGDTVSASEAIERAIVLNEGLDGESVVEALTCGEYLRRTWPVLGEHFLGLIQHVVAVKPGIKCIAQFYDGTKLAAWLQPEHTSFMLEAVGISETVVEVGEMFAWLTAAFRAGVGEEVSHVIPVVEPATGAGQDDGACKIAVRRYVLPPGGYASQGQCWRDLFRNPVVAHGFPVRRRPGEMPGLEIPLAMMAALLQTRRVSVFDGKVLLKGFCTALIPTKQSGDENDNMITWHVLFNEDGSRLSYADPRLRQVADNFGSGNCPRFADVENARHIVGWCNDVRNYVGAKDAIYQVEPTSLNPPGDGFVFDRVTITAGQYITFAVTGVIGKKEKPVRTLGETDYYKQLLWVEKRFVVFFDVKDRRAWLVDGLSALLHLVRASIEHSRSLGLPILIGDNEGEHRLQEAVTTHTGKAAAREVLFSRHNTDITLYRNPPKKTWKKTVTTEGGAGAVEKEVIEEERKLVGLTDRVNDIYHFLSQIFDHQWNDAQDGVGGKLRLSSRRRLEGFDFMDLAGSDDQIFPKALELNATGTGWVDFVRAPTVRAVTLFGGGFGELLKPVAASSHPPGASGSDGGTGGGSGRPPCSRWDTLPGGEDLLAATIADMRSITKWKESTGQVLWEAVPDLYWLDPGGALEEPCGSDYGAAGDAPPRDRTQVFLPRWKSPMLAGRFRSPSRLPEGGAAVFGHSTLFKLHWPDDPELDPREAGDEQGEPPSLPSLDVPASGSGSGPSSPGTMPRIIRSVQTSLQSLPHRKRSSNSSPPSEADGSLSQQNSVGQDSISRRARKKVRLTFGMR